MDSRGGLNGPGPGVVGYRGVRDRDVLLGWEFDEKIAVGRYLLETLLPGPTLVAPLGYRYPGRCGPHCPPPCITQPHRGLPIWFPSGLEPCVFPNTYLRRILDRGVAGHSHTLPPPRVYRVARTANGVAGKSCVLPPRPRSARAVAGRSCKRVSAYARRKFLTPKASPRC